MDAVKRKGRKKARRWKKKSVKKSKKKVQCIKKKNIESWLSESDLHDDKEGEVEDEYRQEEE